MINIRQDNISERPLLQNDSISIEQISGNLSLICSNTSSKQQYYYYQFEDGQKQYAGLKESNYKIGQWNEYMGSQFQQLYFYDSSYFKKVKQFAHVTYWNGKKLGITGPAFGKFNQNGQKVGEWFEDDGWKNQFQMNGKYESNIKVGQWRIAFQGQIIGQGQYDEEGFKFGKWIEPLERYYNLLQLISFGEYRKGLRVGRWATYNKEDYIGGGNYDNEGVKQGNWVDLHEEFWDFCKVTSSGNYSNGIRIGQWITFHETEKIGEGNYDNQGVKQGIWTELYENFHYLCKVTLSGEYKDGKKIGKWTIFIYETTQIGEGNYDDKGAKQGCWTEPHENYQTSGKVTLNGEYRNGVRIGKWIISYEKNNIGECHYDDTGVKQGNWTELHENYSDACQVVSQGEYKGGIRIGNWITKYKDNNIGGGNYGINGLKQGHWIDLHENFSGNHQVMLSGEYRNGIRIGEWVIQYQNNKIGGGNYDDNGVKNGSWIELYENFSDFCQVTYSGEYRDGVRIGKWITYQKEDKIGGGNYDNGVKQGIWTDLYNQFSHFCEVTFSGEYSNGVQIGEWIIQYKKNTIGGGSFDDKGMKSGSWTDIHELFRDNVDITVSGQYQCGMRIGKWITYYKKDKIGEGDYDHNGVKQGNWTDIFEKFYLHSAILCGTYLNGLRIGEWSVIDFEEKQQVATWKYDDNGKKQE